MSTRRARRPLALMTLLAFLFTAMLPATPLAGMVGTDTLIEQEQASVDRDALMEQLERDDIRADLERYGVDADQAMDRVSAMTDAEVQDLTAGLEAHPAGQGVSVTALLLIIIIVLLIR